jgi:hypothetical protein
MVSTLLLFAVQLASIVALLLAVVAVHEAGHALAGHSCGFRIQRIRIGSLKFSRDRKHKWRVGFGIRRGGEVAVQLKTVPGKFVRVQCILFILGGPFANFLLPIVVWPLTLWSTAAANMAGVFALASAALGLINLIPFRTRFGASDGAKLFSLLVDGAAKEEFIFRVSLFARVEEINAFRSSRPQEAVSKLEELIGEAESIAKQRKKPDLAQLAARLKEIVGHQDANSHEISQTDAPPTEGFQPS